MNILLLASHAVAEYDDIRMFTDMGHDVFCPGGYQDPRQPGEGIRPGIPNAPAHPDLIEACEKVRAVNGDPGPKIDWAKAFVSSTVVEWADIIIVHHFPEVWIAQQWPRIRHKRVVWRTCGQSNPHLEQAMARYRRDGLQIVRYSPAERRYFEPRKAWAGEDALIRFGKYPGDYAGGYLGDIPSVGNLTQDLVARGDSTGYGFWLEATAGLQTFPAGKGSEAIGGAGILTYSAMLNYLRSMRAYLYTGTRPASYTLGLIEAMLSGVQVVSIDAGSWGAGWGGSELFEAHEIASGYPADWARAVLSDYLGDHDKAREAGEWGRKRAIDLFGIDQISARWQDFLDGREAKPQPPMSYLDTLPEVA
jgi:hypothetical protein